MCVIFGQEKRDYVYLSLCCIGSDIWKTSYYSHRVGLNMSLEGSLLGNQRRSTNQQNELEYPPERILRSNLDSLESI